MPPQQPQIPSSRPQPSQPQVAPHAPHLGYGSLPNAQDRFQQHPETGQYEVVSPLPAAPNDGQSGHNPYQFIFEADQARKSRGIGLTGTSFVKRIALIIGGLVVMLMIAAAVISALTPKGSVPGMIAIAQRQEEIVRIATEASQQATGTDVQNFVANTSLSVSSSQQTIINYAAAHKVKLGGKTLTLDKSAQTDTQLAAAATANNYDSAVTQNLVGQLQAYEKLLQTTYKQTDSKTAQQILQTNYNNADLLLKQGQAVAKDLSS